MAPQIFSWRRPEPTGEPDGTIGCFCVKTIYIPLWDPDANHGAGICTPTKLGHKYGVNVGKYAIHGASGLWDEP